MSRKWMAELEKKIVLTCVENALRLGYLVEVNDGEAIAQKATNNKAAIMGACFSTDEDVLTFFKHEGERGKRQVGYVWLVYGNGVDVISDYGDNAETRQIIAPAEELADKYTD